jgi:hypothetical protein
MSAYSITEVGFQKAEAAFLRTTVEMASEYELAKWLWVREPDADVILINSDRTEYTTNLTFDKPTQFKIRPILISCSTSSKEIDSFSYTLKMPFTYTMITNLLSQLENELAVASCSSSALNTQNVNMLNNKQQCTTSLLKKLFGYYRTQTEFKALNPADTADVDNKQYLNKINDALDEDSDYDVYDLLMDSEICSDQPDVTPILKPISEQTLKNETDFSSGNYLEVNTNNKPKVSRRRFLEQRRLLGLLRQIVASGNSSLITHYKYPPIRIYPRQNIFSYRLPGDLSPDIFTAQASGFSINELTQSHDQPSIDRWKSMPLWLLFYLATLYGSEGGLKDNYSPDDKLNLTSKPDFDLVPNDLEYLILADYMLNREPQDLHTIATGSDINIKTVIDFCNACEEIDILDRTPSNNAEIRLSHSISHTQKPESLISDNNGTFNNSLFKKFMSKFKHTV